MRERKSKKRIIGYIFIAILIGLLGYLNYIIFKNHILGFNNINWIILGLSIVVILLLLLINVKTNKNIVVVILVLLIAGATTFMIVKMNNVVGVFDDLEENSNKRVNVVKALVLKNSSYKKLDDLKDEKVLALQSDKKNIIKAFYHTNDSVDVIYKKGNVDLYKELLNKKAECIILTSRTEALTDKVYDKHKFREIYRYEIVEKSNQNKKLSSNKQFNIYISGLDTYGAISTVSRSDVNIIMTVNLETGKVLLTTTPRDAYVKIADGGADAYDKLTHSGIYGIQSSVHTLENLYNQKIDYFIKFNFESFIKVIDMIGGVDVYNDQNFVSSVGNHNFPVGKIHLTSETALGFVRERYSLASGDNDRGANQEKVIKAVLEKVSKPENLLNADNVFKEMAPYIQTNISLRQMMMWTNYQMNDGKKISVENTALKGTGVMGLPSYAMPNARLYMSKVNPDSLNEIKIKMNNIMVEK